MGAVVSDREAQIEAACEVLHDAYEVAAREAGWETQERSRVRWAELPEANQQAMRAGVSSLFDHLFGSGGSVSHRLVWPPSPAHCSCGGWEPKLGESIFRGFDRHVLEATR